MVKLMAVVPAEGDLPLCRFFQGLEDKQRRKLLTLFLMLMRAPAAVMREPYVKHFTLERYQSLYELRAKSKILVRIIFCRGGKGELLLLTPFIKHSRRDTMQALEAALAQKAAVEDGTCSVRELSIEFFRQGGAVL